MAMAAIADLATLIRERQPCVVLTGAGISTESGIPDFRSPTGIWANVDPFEVASVRAFEEDPGRVWDFYRARIQLLLEAEPNRGHLALAELERRGLVEAVVTQNIDLLHTRAGSENVVEVHGSIATASCPRCRRVEGHETVLAQLERPNAPTCPACGAVLKPDVVLFGELLPAAAIERATELASSAELMLVVGSSLEVWPVAGLPLEARSLAIVNRGPTALDEHAVLTIEGGTGDVLGAALDLL
jgi:NAD-dependent deacetylase